jgi:hypothetical protein
MRQNRAVDGQDLWHCVYSEYPGHWGSQRKDRANGAFEADSISVLITNATKPVNG